MDEKRRETRKKVMAFTPVYTFDRRTLLGYLGDLTLQGAMVVGKKALPVDTLLKLSIELPGDLPGISEKHMAISARVAHCLLDEENHQDYHIGFAFTEIDQEQEKIIQAILERYHFRHVGWQEVE